MIRKLKYATIADIATFNLKFYDDQKEKELKKFCRKNGITYLPTKCRISAFKLEGNDFIKTKIEDISKVNLNDLIFYQSTIDKFEEVDHNEVRFIMESGEIKAVVHIVDYNNDSISIELFKALLQFETNVRNLLIENNLTNEKFIVWVEKKSISSNNKKYWQRRLNAIYPEDEKRRLKTINKMENANPFQTFTL